MKLQNFLYDFINQKFEKRFIKMLWIKLKEENVDQIQFLIEEITQKAPLIYENYVKDMGLVDRKKSMHLRIASFILSTFSSLRICIKDKEKLVNIIKEICKTIFYKEVRLLFKIALILAKDKLIAIWNYFFIFSPKFKKLFFENEIDIEKDYNDKKIFINLSPNIYKEFFSKHKAEFLIIPSLSYLDAIILVIEKDIKDLYISKEEDSINLNFRYTISYK